MTQFRLLCEKGTFSFLHTGPLNGARIQDEPPMPPAKSRMSPFPGDTVRITIGGIGELTNPVVEGE